ncbi:PDR/VanB family oxidoreductase [Glaciimonas sp. PAMC28666]|uniref:PDR/VanB family oxidoreductase n=1 Tax=Glaciimonas sp. PAMC28666 TaxID=2807626 RepID=UPI001964DD88|nr:PDR/VanB family oxidoreductase [Glaciimonas sp. PAMC28666]QRX83041.1 oxidoreductase [Glaciimonas sp. PAMC28666]
MDQLSQLSVTVVNKVEEAIDIVSFELASLDGQPLPAFSAGAHIDVHIGEGLIRQYSLCNDPSEQHRYLIGVLRDPNSRGGSVAIHDQVKVGATLQISVPRNHFVLTQAKRTLLFAGGIGVTPILCMAERLAQIDADFEMHYCTRAVERTAFHARIAASSFSPKVQFHFDSGAPEQKLDLATLIATPDPDTHLYVCGPGGFIEHVLSNAKSLGWAIEQVHFEYFDAPAEGTQDTSSDALFEIKIASTGKVYMVPPDQTVTRLLAEHGIDIPVSCEQGVCGTCITRVLQGTPDHRDLYFTDEEHGRNDQFTPCCSRSKSPLLVLDI